MHLMVLPKYYRLQRVARQLVRPGLDGLFPPTVDSRSHAHRFDARLGRARHVGGTGGLEMIVPAET